jgi:glycosyltransferase involved in cell wall biosynthesis
VEDSVNGVVCEPTAEAIGSALNALAIDRGRTASLGGAGFERVRAISWDNVIERLVGTDT